MKIIIIIIKNIIIIVQEYSTYKLQIKSASAVALLMLTSKCNTHE